jgi:hypothetical protein
MVFSPMSIAQTDNASRKPLRLWPGVVIAVGYLGSPDVLPAALREREVAPRTRRPLAELVFEDRWGVTSSLFR